MTQNNRNLGLDGNALGVRAHQNFRGGDGVLNPGMASTVGNTDGRRLMLVFARRRE